MLKPIALFIAATVVAFAQVGGTCPDSVGSVFPGQLDTNASMTVAVNNLGTNLTATLSPSSTTMNVSSTTGFLPWTEATIDVGANTEIAYVTGIVSGTVLSIVHPCEGTSAVSHQAGSPVVNNQTAYAGSGAAKSAIFAIEAFLQSGGLNGIIQSGAQYQVPYYVTSPTGTTVAGDVGLTYNQPSALLTATNATVTTNFILSSQTGSTQCAQFSSSGQLTGTGSTCGSGGGSGTVTASPQYEIASFTSAGTTALVAGTSGFKIQSGVMTVPELTISGLTGGPFCLSETSGVVSDTGGACGTVNSGTSNDVAYYTGANTLSAAGGFTFNASVVTVPTLHITNLTGTQCLEINSNVVVGAGTACATASGATNEVAFYNSSTGLTGNSGFTFSSSILQAPSASFTTATVGSAGSCTSALCGQSIGTGSSVVYRCTTAGVILPVGSLTTVSGDCGASVSTLLSVN
jgi:hypothetical protein